MLREVSIGEARSRPMVPRAALVICLAIAPLGHARGGEEPEDSASFFEAKVRPVLAETCFRCHGGEKTSGGLRVDSRRSLLEGGDSGPAIAPGDAEESLLVQAVRRTHESLRMPPDKP